MIRCLGTTEQEYERFLESDDNKGSQEITNAYNALCRAFNDYLSLVTENDWKHGYEYALNLFLSGGAK